ncbi:hypothetical protein K440DRAFT_621715, partial [Wilcoxina mikolae CBS 423.85]
MPPGLPLLGFQISAACFVDAHRPVPLYALRPVPLHALAPTRSRKWGRRGRRGRR